MKKKLQIVFVVCTWLLAILMVGRVYVNGTFITEPFPDTYVPGNSKIETRLTQQGDRVVMQVLGEISSSASDIWDIVKDHKNMLSNTPRIVKSDLIENDEQHEIMRMSFSVWIWERSTEIKAIKKMTENGYVKEWKQIAGSVRTNNGKWDLRSLSPTSTRVLYELEINTNVPVPQWFERGFIIDYLPKVIRRISKK